MRLRTVRARWLAAGLGLTLGGCNGAPTFTAPFASGSRLKVVVEDGGGGALRFFDILDAARGDAPCYLMAVAPDDVRCIPAGSGGYVYFTDPACQDRVVADYEGSCSDGAAPVTASLFVGPAAACGDWAVSVFEVGSAVAAPTALYTLVDGACEPTTVSPEYVFYEAGAQIPPELLARVEVVEVPRTDGLVVRYYTSDDGFFLLSGPRDLARDTSCYPAVVEGVEVCLPSGAASADVSDGSGTYGDPECVEHVASAYGDPTCGTPTFVTTWAYDSAACSSPEAGLAAIGPEITGSVYGWSSGTCEPATPEPDVRYFAIGAKVPVSELVPIESGQEGTGRLRVLRHGAGGAPIDAYGSFFDTQSGLTCHPQDAGGVVRCIPETAWADDQYGPFADPLCAEPLVYAPPSACSSYTFAARYTPSPDGCSGEYAYHQVGPPHAGQVYFDDGAGGCVDGGPLPDYKTLGPEVPVTDFAEVVRRVL